MQTIITVLWWITTKHQTNLLMDHTRLQKWRNLLQWKPFPAVDFRWSWTTVYYLNCGLCGRVVCIVLFWFPCAYYFVFLLSAISVLSDRNFSLNIKFIVFVLQLFLYSKNVRVTSRRLETGSASSGSTLPEEVWQVCIVVSFYLWQMLKLYQFKTHCNGDIHSKTAYRYIILQGLMTKHSRTPLPVQAKSIAWYCTMRSADYCARQDKILWSVYSYCASVIFQ